MIRKIETILEEVHKKCNDDGCQSWNNIAIVAIETALKEQKEEFIEDLNKIYNSLNNSKSIIDTMRLSKLKDYIKNLEYYA